MLTGDKGQTALNIGLSCGLYKTSDVLIKVPVETMETLLNDHLNNALATIRDQKLSNDTKNPVITLSICGSNLPTIYAN